MSTNSREIAIVVFEPRPYWGPELQRQFSRTSIAVRECRAIADIQPSTTEFRAGLIVIDLDSAIGECLAWLELDLSRPRRWPIVACGSKATADLEWLLRDAGVTEFVPDVITGDEFARLCRRQLGLQSS
jgi:hypothetical protein